jgi:pyruvate,water dikinase
LTLVMWLASLEAEHADHRRRELAARREALTAQCLAVLGSRPQLQTRFWALLQVAQRHAVLREHQARQLTVG